MNTAHQIAVEGLTRCKACRAHNPQTERCYGHVAEYLDGVGNVRCCACDNPHGRHGHAAGLDRLELRKAIGKFIELAPEFDGDVELAARIGTLVGRVLGSF